MSLVPGSARWSRECEGQRRSVGREVPYVDVNWKSRKVPFTLAFIYGIVVGKNAVTVEKLVTCVICMLSN